MSESPGAKATSSEPTEQPRRSPWRGKKRVAEAKEKFIAVRCTEADREKITAKANDAGLSVGAFLRATALGSAGPRAVKKPRVEREQLARLLGEIGKLGSNVNQIARRVNTTGDRPGAQELDEMRTDIAVMRAALMKALGRETAT